MSKQADLLSPPVNFAVVQLPARRYPGVVIQGDTLLNLCKQLERMAKLLDARELEELSDDIEFVKEQLGEAMSYFEQVCAERGIALPY